MSVRPSRHSSSAIASCGSTNCAGRSLLDSSISRSLAAELTGFKLFLGVTSKMPVCMCSTISSLKSFSRRAWLVATSARCSACTSVAEASWPSQLTRNTSKPRNPAYKSPPVSAPPRDIMNSVSASIASTVNAATSVASCRLASSMLAAATVTR